MLKSSIDSFAAISSGLEQFCWPMGNISFVRWLRIAGPSKDVVVRVKCCGNREERKVATRERTSWHATSVPGRVWRTRGRFVHRR